MNLTTNNTNHNNQRFHGNAKIIILISAVLAGVLILSAVLDIWGSKRELAHTLKEQSQALITALEKGSQNAIASYDLLQDVIAERLLDNARLLEKMDYHGILKENDLEEIARENDIFRINVYDADGNKEMVSFRGFGWGATKPAADDLMKAIQEEDNDELVIGFKSTRFGTASRFAVAKKRRKGGFIMLNVNTQDMLEFRKSIGLGKLIQEIGENEGVAYIALQDTASIIIATSIVDSLSTAQSDDELMETLTTGRLSTRFTIFQNKRIFEIIHLFNERNQELLRIGLNTSHIKQAEQSALMRAVLSSLLLFIIGGVFAGWLVSVQNVKSLQNAYQRIETYTSRMLENMTDAVVAVDKNGDITLVNDSAERLFGISSVEVVGKSCSLEIVAICTYLKTGLKTKKNRVYEQERLILTEHTITAYINVNVILDSIGTVDTAFAVIRDMTEIKRLEENLKRVDQITAMGHLASGVAHEIRNPLNAIGMIAQRFKSEFEPTTEKAEYEQLSSTMVEETRRINYIIQQFLQFSRPTELTKAPVNIQSLLQDSAILLQSQAAAKDMRVKADYQDTPNIMADADKLKQVFLNLGQNAIDACSVGDQIELSCETQAGYIYIKIKDTGKGMTKAEQQKIFNLYFTTKENGTGIGLSVVQQIISQHDGTIEIESEINEGTTFIIALPIT